MNVVCIFSALPLLCVRAETLHESRELLPGKWSKQGLEASADEKNKTFRMVLA